MKSSKSLEQHVQELKKNVANQSHDSLVEDCAIEDLSQKEEAVDLADRSTLEAPTLVYQPHAMEIMGPTPSTAASDAVHRPEDACREGQGMGSKMDGQRLSMAGMEMLVSTGVSYAIAWGIGSLFTLSSLWRIILGALLAFAVNALAVYRMIKQ